MNGPSKEEQAKWQAENDLRTLTEAARIKSDKARSDAVAKMAKEQAEVLSKIAGKDDAK